MDLKNAITDVQSSNTLRKVLGTLLSIGNFLNGREVRIICTELFLKEAVSVVT